MWSWLLWSACSSDPAWFSAPDPLEDTACPPVPEATTGDPITVDLRVGLGAGINPNEASWHLRWAASWWRPHGVSFRAASRSSGVDGAPILAGTEVQTLRAVLAPVRRHLASRPSDAPAAVDVVFLRTLAEPGSPAHAWFDRLAGLTVSPALLDRLEATDPHAAVLKAAVVDGPFAPTVFLGLDTLDALPQERARFVLAHEFGHALGLVHDPRTGNLMEVGFPRCDPALAPEQRSLLKAP